MTKYNAENVDQQDLTEFNAVRDKMLNDAYLKGYNRGLLKGANLHETLNRLSVIDDEKGGLIYERHDSHLDIHIQDDHQTLKIFVSPKEKESD